MDKQTATLVKCPVAASAREHPEVAAIETPHRTISYAELNELVGKVAAALEARRIGVGSVVSMLPKSDWRTPVVVWALLRIGACVVPLNARQPVTRLKEQAALVKSGFSISDETFAGPGSIAMTWNDLLDDGSDVASTPDLVPALNLGRVATVIFTSGSTGLGKGVVHELGSHWHSAVGSQARIPVDVRTRWLVALPFYHVGGLSILFRCFLHGGCVVLGRDAPLDEVLKSSTPTHISLVPTQLHRLFDRDGGESLANLQHVLIGGSRIPSRLVDRATAAGIAIQKSYGLTEMASQVATTRRLADRDELATSGEILPFREVRISDQGEISVRGATLFAGYVGRDSLERPFEDDGWFATGDLGRFDVRGRLIVSGRKDATFISGGENVHPEEIEEAILATGLVDRAVVVPIENEEYGQRPIAFVSPLPNESTLRTLLKDRIATFKIPDSFLELPPDTGLKPDRRILKAMANKRLD